MAHGSKLLAASALIVMIALAGCGSSTTSTASNGVTTAGPTTPRTSTVAQLGCHHYCREAGGYGAGPGVSKPAMRILTKGTVALLPNGSVPVTLECQLTSPCRGAILVDAEPVCQSTQGLGRSDLAVDPGSTRTIAVPLSSCVTTAVRTRGRVPVSITADSGESPECRRGNVDCVNPASIVLRPSG